MIAIFAPAGLVAYPTPALAACTNPAGAEGEMIYNDDFNVMQFCNSTSWVSMSGGASAGAESDPQVGATTLNKWCRGDGSGVICDQDTPSVTETDPEVGTLTSGKWCTTNGTEVQCTSDLPIGTLTNGKFCTTNGTTVSCTTDAPTATAGADTQVIFNSGGALTGDASFVWDNTNKRLGIGNTPSTELEVTGTVKSSGPFWSAFGSTGTHRGLLLENFDNTANTHGVDVAAKLGGTEFQGLSWVKETAWVSGDAASAKDAMLQLGVLTDNVATIPMVVRADGKVGIGTATPFIGLHVLKDDPSGAVALFQATTNGPSVSIGVNTGKSALQAAANDTTVGDLVLNPVGGNVGISTTSPAFKLEVVTPYNNGIQVKDDSGTVYGGLFTESGTMALVTRSNHGLRLGTNDATRMTILNTGNVGIGTTGPAGKLHVLGHNSGEVARFQPATDASNQRSFISLYTTNPGFWWEISNQDASGGQLTSGLAFRERSGSGASVERIYIAQGGNVGIGTTSPGEKLEVSGNVKASQFCNASGTCIDIGSIPTFPAGAIMAFDLTTCPTGWSEYTAARGRFLRGIDNGAGNDPSGTRAPSNTQADAFQGHQFNYVRPTLFDENGGTLSSQLARIQTTGATGAPVSDGTNGTPRIANETRPKNVAVLFCRKD